MPIAQLAPVYESVPPRLYGGSERIVSYLTEELVHQGHDVTLFASGDSVSRARVISVTPHSLRLDPTVVDPMGYHIAQLRAVAERAHQFDIIHNHMDYIGFSLRSMVTTPIVTTLHGRLDLAHLIPVFAAYPEVSVVSISNAQQAPFPDLRWCDTVYHGLPLDLYRAGDGSGGYLAFLGRICPEKRVDSAIRVAEAVGVPLKVAAKVDRVDRAYFDEVIDPMLRSPLVEFIGEIDDAEKNRFLGDARALLFPIDWPEPFGLTMIEALACGTPVIARRRGSVPEIIDHGQGGFVCDDDAAMIAAVRQLNTIDRRRCRALVEARFTTPRMAQEYLRIYEALLSDARTGVV